MGSGEVAGVAFTRRDEFDWVGGGSAANAENPLVSSAERVFIFLANELCPRGDLAICDTGWDL
ncbi:hypothetical protein MCNS_31180 [Mycobacterium conspicuum]|uniref:Uncharacterized protein n=1 Tax=Mycobacterium conspicuum TaxID=44010 RepID=A0A7I7YE68_9MYCO|nr:hypothetical protein MCNS_31180 [Mycobacterium conspicuum]